MVNLLEDEEEEEVVGGDRGIHIGAHGKLNCSSSSVLCIAETP